MHDCRLVASGCPRDEGMSPTSHQSPLGLRRAGQLRQDPRGSSHSWISHRQAPISGPEGTVLGGVPSSSSLPSLRSILPAAHGGEA